MSPTWEGGPPPETEPRGLAGQVRAVVKGTSLGLVVFGGLGVHLMIRLVEAPVYGASRPWTPAITRAVCRAALRIIGLRTSIEGAPLRASGSMVANHASWLDIFVLNSATTLYFVAKAEVADWPGIGWLARATGTVFIARQRKDAARHRDLLKDRIAAGHRLLFFPEGTSTDGRQVLGFKPTLFAATMLDGTPDGYTIQPVSVVYAAPEGEDPRFYGWWGDMSFGGHLLKVLTAPRQGTVRLVFHDPLPVTVHPDRKSLARAAEAAVRSPFER